jgi:molybdenum cofactor cytidylyltransferase
MSCGIIILAAGASTRLGRPKQLLKFHGSTLLRRAAETALATRCRPVFVVLGSNAGELRREISSLPVSVLINPDWHNGIGGSIREGIRAISELIPRPDAAALLLCDQPLVTASSIDELAARRAATGKLICAAKYSATLGTPAVFAAGLFDELLNLGDAEGGKSVIARHAAETEAMEIAEAAMDVDTEADFKRLSSE